MNRTKQKPIDLIEQGFKKNPDRRVRVYPDYIVCVRSMEAGKQAEVLLINGDTIVVSMGWGDYDKVLARVDAAKSQENEFIETMDEHLNREKERLEIINRIINKHTTKPAEIIEDVRDQLNKMEPEERVKFIEKMTSGYCKICGVYSELNFECGCKPWVR